MTFLLIGVGTLGEPELAADIAIVQGATLAVFFAFSANARSIILGRATKIPWELVLRARVILLVPLGVAALVISFYLTEAAPAIALALVLRRCSEWLSEIYLARGERLKRYSAALWFIAIQSVLLVVAIVSALVDHPHANLGILIWALLPMVLTAGFVMKHFHFGSLFDAGWSHMFPHFGSTAITGITVFVFRLVILLIVGKAYAGNLFTAFAMGGVLGSVFAQAIGPTLVFHAKEGLISDMPRWLKACLIGSATAGIALVFASSADWHVLSETAKPAMFWSATGASLIGGTVMVFAQLFRLRLLQHHETGDAFGPDVLTNIFIVACVPYGYYLLGIEALSWLFFVNAAIALVFYFSAERTTSSGRKTTSIDNPALRITVAVGIVFPMFFQLSGRIFRDKDFLVDSGGDILNLPIPISVLVCYAAIVFIGTYNRARESLAVIFLCFCLMILSTVLATELSTQSDGDLQQGKIILLIQFILPMLALVLGQTYGGNDDSERSVAKACLYVLALVIPLQLMATWLQSLNLLAFYLYFFSVYQHLQYVPVVFVCGFVLACFSLWQEMEYRKTLMVLAIPVGAYAILSISILALSGLLIGSLIFVAYMHLQKAGKLQKGPLLLLALIVVGIYGALPVAKYNLIKWGKVGNISDPMSSTLMTSDEIASREPTATSDNIASDDEGVTEVDHATRMKPTSRIATRLEVWQFYIRGITNTGYEWAFGHESPPERERHVSAHNYYLDFVYNFGLVALVPFIWLIVFTLWKSGRHWKAIAANPGTFATVGVVVFLLLVDNSLKVGMRQPYSGIVTFFLWGILLSRLIELDKSREVDDS